MFCPQCGAEYGEGVTTCSTCNVLLTSEPPPAADAPLWQDLVTVLRTEDAGLFTVAKSLLEAEGIPCFATGEEIGHAVTGSNQMAGPTALQVPRERADEARELLASRDESVADEEA